MKLKIFTTRLLAGLAAAAFIAAPSLAQEKKDNPFKKGAASPDQKKGAKKDAAPSKDAKKNPFAKQKDKK